MNAPAMIELVYWRGRFRQQRLSNACYWLEEIEQAADPTRVIALNYDNILRAIEMTLEHEDSFDVSYDLLQGVYQTAFELADWDRWLVYLQAALEMSQKLGEKTSQAYLHDWIATLLLVLGRQDQAEPHLQQALQLYLEINEVSRYGRTLPKLARIHALRREYDSSFNLCQEALRLGESQQDKLIIADAYFGLSSLYYLLRDWTQALTHGQKALCLYEAMNNQNFASRTRGLIIGCKTSLGYLEGVEQEAEELLKALTDPKNSLNNNFNVVQLRTTMGVIAFKQGNYQAAEAHWQEAFQLNTLIGSRESEAAPLRNNLGKAYTKMGEWKEAWLMFTGALSYYKQMNRYYEWGNCMDNLADLHEAQEDYAACRETLQEAITYLELFRDQLNVGKLCRAMRERLEKLPSA